MILESHPHNSTSDPLGARVGIMETGVRDLGGTC